MRARWTALRWHRCLRCDSWLPLARARAAEPSIRPSATRSSCRCGAGRCGTRSSCALIAVDRGFHFVVLALLAVAIFLFAANQRALRDTFYQVVTDVQQGFGGGPVHNAQHRLPARAGQGASRCGRQLHVLGAAVGAYAILERVEAVGLWWPSAGPST